MKRFSLVALILLPVYLFAFTGEVDKTFKTPGNYPSGLTWDGQNLWISDFKTDRIYQLDSKGNVIKDIPSPAYWATGLTWDGKYLWVSDYKGLIPQGDEYHRGKIYKIDPENGHILHSMDAPTPAPVSITWDGKYLWCVDDISRVMIQFDPNDGTTIKELIAPASAPEGITFDGKYLWVSDRMRDQIYMVNPATAYVIVTANAPGNYARDLAWDGKRLWNVDLESKQIYSIKVRDDEKYRISNEYQSHYIFTHTFTNFGPGKMLNGGDYPAITENRPNQQITSKITVLPEAKIETDQWGQRCYHFHYENLKPGEQRESQMELDFTTHEVQWFLYPEQCGKLADVPMDIKKLYLADDAKYQIHAPVIQDAVNKAVGDETNSYWVMRNIFNYLIENMYYERVGGWNTAPTVLARGNGSCSEYAFVFISMCRAAGLPARYVGSVVKRGDDRSIDDVFHRWVEVYLPNYGWVPVDPSGGDRKYPADQANYIGHLSNRYLITTQSGGGSELLNWSYNSYDKYTSEAQSNVAVDYWGEMEKKD